ncbi:MAG: lipopolysaccharide core heptose(I) kinase RfaP [Gammaproteobacteria bacterium]
MIECHESLKPLMEGSDPWQTIFSLQGTLFRDLPRRKTLCFEFEGKQYFAKLHYGVGWREIIKNICSLRLPVISAKPEWLAIKALHRLNVNTMQTVAFGIRYQQNPAYTQSFLITKALNNTVSLEELCQHWIEQPPSFTFKYYLLKQVANIAHTMHAAGINHRDFYICHFLLDCTNQQLFLIDLHRAQRRRVVPQRWLIKDLGSLLFSALDIGLTLRDCLRFMKIYHAQPLRVCMIEHKNLWRAVIKRAQYLYYKMHGRYSKHVSVTNLI